ncbi:hypothetical protein SESBI_24312 [Sesbania bispinosa]|nr:hypothetical protein SESBI_24312 [Sesbania bispinosa]
MHTLRKETRDAGSGNISLNELVVEPKPPYPSTAGMEMNHVEVEDGLEPEAVSGSDMDESSEYDDAVESMVPETMS